VKAIRLPGTTGSGKHTHLREVAAQFEKPALLFSGGKDSITLVHLARKAFAPGKIPFPLVHIDTGLISRKHSLSEINWRRK